MVTSARNFQLLGPKPGGKGEEEKILLQFRKVGQDDFTMDDREPLSAFQAFAICLATCIRLIYSV